MSVSRASRAVKFKNLQTPNGANSKKIAISDPPTAVQFSIYDCENTLQHIPIESIELVFFYVPTFTIKINQYEVNIP